MIRCCTPCGSPMAGQDARTGNYWFVRAGVLFIGVQIGDRYFPNHTDFMASVAERAGA